MGRAQRAHHHFIFARVGTARTRLAHLRLPRRSTQSRAALSDLSRFCRHQEFGTPPGDRQQAPQIRQAKGDAAGGRRKAGAAEMQEDGAAAPADARRACSSRARRRCRRDRRRATSSRGRRRRGGGSGNCSGRARILAPAVVAAHGAKRKRRRRPGTRSRPIDKATGGGSGRPAWRRRLRASDASRRSVQARREGRASRSAATRDARSRGDENTVIRRNPLANARTFPALTRSHGLSLRPRRRRCGTRRRSRLISAQPSMRGHHDIPQDPHRRRRRRSERGPDRPALPLRRVRAHACQDCDARASRRRARAMST